MPNMSSSIVLLLCKQFVIIAYFEAAKIEKKTNTTKKHCKHFGTILA